VDLHREHGANAGDQLIDAHLDRLPETKQNSGNCLFELPVHLFDQGLFIQTFSPLAGRLELDVALDVVDVFGISFFRRADFGEDKLDLGELQQNFFGLLCHRDRLVQGRAGDIGDPILDRTLFQYGDEFGTYERKRQKAQNKKQDRQTDRERSPFQAAFQKRHISALDPAHEKAIFLRPHFKKPARENRDQSERDDQRARHGETDGNSHRLEHLSLYTLERKQRKKNNDDN